MRILPRVCFALLATLALASVLGSCTRRGTPSPLPSGSGVPTSRTVYVNAKTGNDKSNGSQTTPFKTVTRALVVAASPGPIPVTDIEIATGDYNAANGEKFPLQFPSATTLTINGTRYGRGESKGTFIDGAGEDTAFEKIVDAQAGSYFTTMEFGTSASGINLTNLYVGVALPKLPIATTIYNALDVMGSVTATTAAFESATAREPRLNGVLVPGGTFACTSCAIGGTGYAIAAFSLATSDCGTATQCPTLTLTGPATSGQGLIGGTTGIRTDGSAIVTVSNQTFSSSNIGFADDFPPILIGIVPVLVDLGQGPESPNSTGGNVLLGALTTEISLTLAGDTVTAFGDTWNPNIQGTDASGQFKSDLIFGPGKHGRNVTVANAIAGARVKVGPFKHATPTPSTSPSTSPTGSTTPSPSPSPT
jgi:Protein of unknown function (DUF1565)